MKTKQQRNKLKIEVVHHAPGKKGKVEYRYFDTLDQVNAYLVRNEPKRLKAK